jgi:ABC-type glycerol-3-phosphate transport system substrate-binding protein
VEVIRAQSPAWLARQKASLEFAPDAAKADIWVVTPAEIAQLAGSPAVPDAFTARDSKFAWNSLLPLYREQLCRADGKPVSVPLTGEALVCAYRSDLFTANEAKYAAWQKDKKAAPLRPPLTWTEFHDQAKFFAQANGRPSLPPLPASVEGLDRLFHAIAAPHARRAIRADEDEGKDHLDEVFYFHYDRKGQPRLNTPGFVESLKLLGELRKYAGTDAEALAKGEAVLGVIEAGELAALQRSPAVRDRFGVCAVPGADRFWDFAGNERRPAAINFVPYLGGRGLLAGVNPGAKNAAAAWDLLAELAGPMRSSQTALEPRWGGGPTRSDQMLRDRWDSFGLDSARSHALREAVSRTLLQHGIKNPVLVLRTPDQAERRLALHRALVGEKTLEWAAQQWEELDRKKGKDKAMADYKRSLGLIE